MWVAASALNFGKQCDSAVFHLQAPDIRAKRASHTQQKNLRLAAEKPEATEQIASGFACIASELRRNVTVSAMCRMHEQCFQDVLRQIPTFIKSGASKFTAQRVLVRHVAVQEVSGLHISQESSPLRHCRVGEVPRHTHAGCPSLVSLVQHVSSPGDARHLCPTSLVLKTDCFIRSRSGCYDSCTWLLKHVFEGNWLLVEYKHPETQNSQMRQRDT